MAEMSGWEFPATYGDVIGAVHATWYGAVHGDTAVQLPMPWSSAERTTGVTPEERDRLKQILLRRSAFVT